MMKNNNLEKKASEIKSMIIREDSYMDVIKISPSSGINLSVSKIINGNKTHLAYFYPKENKVLWSNPEYKIFFENLSEKYKENFKKELKIGKWPGYHIEENQKIEQDE